MCQIFTTQDMQFAGAFTTSNTSELRQIDESSVSHGNRTRRQSPTSAHTSHLRKLRESGGSKGGGTAEVATIVSVSSPAVSENGGSPDKSQQLTKHQPIRPKQYASAAIQSMNENAEIERRVNLANFERWLAGVNERMNAAMNYQFD